MHPLRLILSFVCLLSAAHFVIAVENSPPNIFYIISDDHDYEHLGFMGNEFVHTPTLDSLPRSGGVFTTAQLTRRS